MFFDDFDKDGIKGRESQLAQDFLQFDGNAQTLRLLMKLQVLSDEYGLNLTFGTLSAACKYVVASNSVDRKKAGAKKPGFFASEAAEIEEIRHQTGTNGARNPITFLVEASDDICYSTVDIEDGITKGVLNWRTFKDELRKRSKGGVNQQTIKDLIERTERTINQASMKPDGEAVDTAHAQVLRTSLIGLLVEAAATRFAKEYNRIMEGTYDEDLLSGSDAAEIAKILKDIGREIVYCSKETLALELRGRRVIHDLMDVFYEGVCVPENKPKPKTFPGKAYNLLSNNYRVVFKYCIKNDPMPLKYRRLQLLTDYIAGMTDTFACSLHRQLTNGGCGERS